MRLLFIRHGDPDYEHDTLTPAGHREAQLLARTAKDLRLGTVFQSPLGRAQDTAAYSLKETGLTAQTFSWLQEFPAMVDINPSAELQYAYPNCRKNGERFQTRISWDMIPAYRAEHPEYADPAAWRVSEVSKHSNIEAAYDEVKREFNKLLAQHGYVKDGQVYRVEKANEETLTFFCHFGVTCVLLSVLWDISPFQLWHQLCMLPTSVTEVVTEERVKGIACFRALRIGDVSHLYAGGAEPSFSARFCETYDNFEQRH